MSAGSSEPTSKAGRWVGSVTPSAAEPLAVRGRSMPGRVAGSGSESSSGAWPSGRGAGRAGSSPMDRPPTAPGQRPDASEMSSGAGAATGASEPVAASSASSEVRSDPGVFAAAARASG